MIDYRGARFPKPIPRVVLKMAKATLSSKRERACRKDVDRRDRRVCFYPTCRSYASDKHHILPTSLRGSRVWLTADILSSCRLHHQWFKAGLIRVAGNPDVKHSIRVRLTALGRAAKLKVPKVA